MSITYNQAREELLYEVQQSSNLFDWSTVDVTQENGAATISAPQDSPRIFTRLRVAQP